MEKNTSVTGTLVITVITAAHVILIGSYLMMKQVGPRLYRSVLINLLKVITISSIFARKASVMSAIIVAVVD